MGIGGSQPQPSPSEPSASERLDSWKEIAAYLRRDESTVRRWEKEGLPVHRHNHKKKASVYAHKSEIDAWWTRGRIRLEVNRCVDSRLWQRRATIVAGSALTVLAVGLAWNVGGLRERFFRPNPVSRITSLAVLPLENLTGDPQQDYLAAGITEALINEFAQIRALRVISRTSVIGYKNAGKSLPQIASELHVDGIVEGSVQRVEGRVSVSVQLVHGPTDRHLWAQSYERDFRDVLSLQREVAREVAREIKVDLTPKEQAHLARAHPLNPEAYELYLKGRFLMSQWGVEENIRKAISYFEGAVQKEPTYAAGHAALAFGYLELGAALVEAVPPKEILPKAREEVQKAMELDEASSEAHEMAGWIALAYDWDWARAERAFRRAIELNPSYPSPYMWLSQYLNVAGQHQEALGLIRRAQQLDPLSPHIQWSLAESAMLAGESEFSAEQCEKGIDLHPDFWPLHTLLGEIYLRQREYDRSLVSLERSVEISKRHPHALAVLGSAYALSGRRRDSRRILSELRDMSQRRYLSPADIARVYASLGENEHALFWLEKAHTDRSSWMTRIHLWGPELGNLRADPRFQGLVRRMNFPQQETKSIW
jgi:TolB-like protein/Flp pilus assembly protein TadD